MCPSLAHRFEAALGQAAAELRNDPEVTALLFFGSAARGEATERSDLDLYAITSGDARGHRGWIEDGIPVEVSFGSIERMRELVHREIATVVHAFSTGRVLFDREGRLSGLCNEATALWARGPSPLTRDAEVRWRFHLTDAARDLEDAPANAPETALAAAACVQLSIDGYCAAVARWAPPPRRAVRALREFAPAVADLVERCAVRGFPPTLAVELADAALAKLGGRLIQYDTRSAPPLASL